MELGHQVKDCTNEVHCVICGAKGEHQTNRCPGSSKKLKTTEKVDDSSGDDTDTTDSDSAGFVEPRRRKSKTSSKPVKKRELSALIRQTMHLNQKELHLLEDNRITLSYNDDVAS